MNWRKSSRSFANGNCVEVADDWRKARDSMSNGNCVEVAGAVLVRDTADRDGAVLGFTGTAWTAFTATLKGRMPAIVGAGTEHIYRELMERA